MTSIISGVRYSTDTAEAIYYFDNGFGASDFKLRSKYLYRTKKGKYFIEHYGGAMTEMAVRCGQNNMCGSSSIEPISDKEAFVFLCEHGKTDKAGELFEGFIVDA